MSAGCLPPPPTPILTGADAEVEGLGSRPERLSPHGTGGCHMWGFLRACLVAISLASLWVQERGLSGCQCPILGVSLVLLYDLLGFPTVGLGFLQCVE